MNSFNGNACVGSENHRNHKSLKVYYSFNITWWAKKVSYCTFSISSLNIDQFSQFFHQQTLKKNFLLTGMHTTPIMLLHYLVKYKYPKTYNIYIW